jgi:hypothetical protein
VLVDQNGVSIWVDEHEVLGAGGRLIRALRDHQPAFEAWNGLPFAQGDKHFELRVQLAVL